MLEFAFVAKYFLEKGLDISSNFIKDTFKLNDIKNATNIYFALAKFNQRVQEEYSEDVRKQEILNFWNSKHIAEELIKICYTGNSDFGTYYAYKSYIEQLLSNKDCCNIKNDVLSLTDELEQLLSKKVETQSQFSSADIATLNRVVEKNIQNVTSEQILKVIEEKIPEIFELIKSNDLKSSEPPQPSQVNIENLRFPSSEFTSIKTILNPFYKHRYYLFNSIEFEGNFGSNPIVYLIYSEKDEPISFDPRKNLTNNLSITKLNKGYIQGNKYRYHISEQTTYFSNGQSDYDIRPIIIVIFGEKSICFITIIVINKSVDRNNTVPRLSFRPRLKVCQWPKKSDLLTPIDVPQIGKSFQLKLEDVKGVIELRDFFEDLYK
ncbi:hypothetical protein [Streptococcus sobrinus]|uniref:hypothetical protein n=1 Tax=Streptococcus sobrinus TaxID=1310 RepID=UPI0003067A8B|nr:hypothetical protein [Streptococcus sobrinus]OZV23333.1 hypothetical protein RO09_02305 [Streptococcus sobrinus]